MEAEHTRGTLKLGLLYSIQADKTVVKAEKKLGGGKHTLAAAYTLRDETTALTWTTTHKPCKVLPGMPGAGRGAGRGMGGSMGGGRLAGLVDIVAARAAFMSCQVAFQSPPPACCAQQLLRPPPGVVRGKAGKGGVSGMTATVSVAHEFDI